MLNVSGSFKFDCRTMKARIDSEWNEIVIWAIVGNEHLF